MNSDTQELARIMDEIQRTAMPEFFDDGSVRIHCLTYEAGSLIAAAFRNYRDFLLEGA